MKAYCIILVCFSVYDTIHSLTPEYAGLPNLSEMFAQWTSCHKENNTNKF